MVKRRIRIAEVRVRFPPGPQNFVIFLERIIIIESRFNLLLIISIFNL